jgi:hypothetical protein
MFEFDISVLDRVFHIHCVKSFSHVRTDDRYVDMEMFVSDNICLLERYGVRNKSFHSSQNIDFWWFALVIPGDLLGAIGLPDSRLCTINRPPKRSGCSVKA